MGRSIERERFTPQEYELFGARLQENLAALSRLLARPGFGVGPESIGAEIEASIVDPQGRVLGVNEAVFNRCQDPRAQLELVAFNIEFNLTPGPVQGASLTALERELNDTISLLERSCRVEGGHLVPIGIVPTLRRDDLRNDIVTDQPRYRALLNGMAQIQPFPVHLDIHGVDESIELDIDSLAYEGSNTSFQVHLRVAPDRYADTYNAAQLATPFALALAANSPIFLERLLWDETRVPLFKQTFIGRQPPQGEWRPPARVPYGYGWVRRGIHELFAEAVALYPPILAVPETEDSQRMVDAGDLPRLE